MDLKKCFAYFGPVTTSCKHNSDKWSLNEVDIKESVSG